MKEKKKEKKKTKKHYLVEEANKILLFHYTFELQCTAKSNYAL